MAQNKSKTGWFEYIYFFMIVIYTAMAIPFFKCMMAYYNEPIGFILPIVMTTILLIRNKLSFNNKNLLILLAIFSIWLLIQYFSQGTFYSTLTFFAFYNILIAYILIKIYKAQLFFLYEKMVTQLSIIAIIFWILMVLFPNQFGSLIDLIKLPNSETSILSGNIVIYSMTDLSTYSDVEILGLTRNSGFSWEPGRYASMLVIALYFNLARTKCEFKGNKGFWILLLALLTTQSTTGFMALSILFIFILTNKNIQSKFLYALLIIPIILMLFNLPFIGEKLTNLMDLETSMAKVEVDLDYTDEDETYVPQRFDGLAFEFMNIVHDPIWGYGIDDKESYTKKEITAALGLSNGIFKVFARFGIILGTLFYIFLFKSSKWVSDYYNVKGASIYFFLFLAISISYDFTIIPFFLALTLISLFNPLEDIQINK